MKVLEDSHVDSVIADSDWERVGSELLRQHTARDFADALAYVNVVGAMAEEANHHPDIDIRWNKVTLRLSTHSAGGITAADLELAHRIDSIES